MGTSAQNKALVERFIDCLNTGDVAGAAACFDAERYYSHPHGADLAGTWEQMKARRRAGAFTDFSSERVALVADGDRVVHHSRVTSTHSGTFLGVPATGRRVMIDQVEIWRIEEDKIVEHWGGLAETERLYNELAQGDDR
jgi:predicted ester cyclase